MALLIVDIISDLTDMHSENLCQLCTHKYTGVETPKICFRLDIAEIAKKHRATHQGWDSISFLEKYIFIFINNDTIDFQ